MTLVLSFRWCPDVMSTLQIHMYSFKLCPTFHCNLTVRFTFIYLIQSNVEETVKNYKSALQLFNCTLSSNKQLDYSGNWDTFKNCNNYIEYIWIADGFVSNPYFFILERLFIQRKLNNEHTAIFWFIQSSIRTSSVLTSVNNPKLCLQSHVGLFLHGWDWFGFFNPQFMK